MEELDDPPKLHSSTGRCEMSLAQDLIRAGQASKSVGYIQAIAAKSRQEQERLDKVERVLSLIVGKMKVEHIAEASGYSKSAAQKYVSDLLDTGKIAREADKRTSPPTYIYWRLK